MDDTPGATLGRLIVGFQVSDAIHVAATLGIADLLAEGPRTSDELAAATNAHAGSMYRLLRALASVGVFHEEEGRRFSTTPMGALLRSDVPGSLRGWAMFVGRPYFREAWGHLEHSIRTGDNAFRHVHGTDVWTYRADHPDESAIFDLAMESLTGASPTGRFSTPTTSVASEPWWTSAGATARCWRRSSASSLRRAASFSISPTSSPTPPPSWNVRASPIDARS